MKARASRKENLKDKIRWKKSEVTRHDQVTLKEKRRKSKTKQNTNTHSPGTDPLESKTQSLSNASLAPPHITGPRMKTVNKEGVNSKI